MRRYSNVQLRLCTLSDRYSSGACSLYPFASVMAGGGVGKSRLDGLSVVCAVLALFLLGTIDERLYIKVQTMTRKYTQHINYEQAPIVRPYFSALCHCRHLFLVMVSSCGWHRCSWHLVLSPSPDNKLNHQIAK